MIKYMSKGVISTVIILGILGFGSWAGWSTYGYYFRANPKSPTGEYTIEVEKGDTFVDIQEKLVKDNVTQNSFEIVSKLYTKNSLYPGEYKLKLPANTEQIIKQINEQSVKKAKDISQNARESKKVTIKEGGNVDSIAKLLEKEGVLSDVDDFKQKATAPGLYNYDFLPTPLNCQYGDRKNCVLYYLEGYLYPDTYDFFVDSTGDEIIVKMLENYENKVWKTLGSKYPKKDFDKAIIMASVIERETGRSKQVAGEKPSVIKGERAKVASVFYNRIEQSVPWSSDPTVNYGIENLVCQQTTEIKDCVYLDDAKVQTKYNTYNNKGYPIGPISNPQIVNIEAALDPADTDYLFFVADLNGVTLFASDDAGHSKNIAEVTGINKNLEE
jgi:UPF0755 protein